MVARAQQPGDIPWELNAEYYAQRAGFASYFTQEAAMMVFQRGPMKTSAAIGKYPTVQTLVRPIGASCSFMP